LVRWLFNFNLPRFSNLNLQNLCISTDQESTQNNYINDEVKFLAIEYVDTFIKNSNNTINEEEIYLITATCLFIAVKFLYNESNPKMSYLANKILNRKYSV